MDLTLRQRLIQGSLWLSFGALTARALTLLSSVVLARVLGREGLGEFGVVLSTLATFEVLAGFGLHATVSRHVAQWRVTDPERASRMVALGLRVSMLSGLLVAGLLVIMADWLARVVLGAPHLRLLIQIGSLSLLWMALDAAQTGGLMGLEAFRPLTLVNLLHGFLYPPVMVGAVLLDGVRGAVWGSSLCLGVKYLMNRHFLHRSLDAAALPTGIRIHPKDWSVLWTFSLPSVLTGLLVTPVTWACHVLLVNQPGGYAQLGMLGVVASWMLIITFVPSILGNLAMPILANLIGGNERKAFSDVFRLKVGLAAGMALLTAIPIALCARFILKLYGPSFAEAEPVLLVSCAGAVITSILSPLGAPITSFGRMWTSFGVNAVWALTYLGLAFIWIPSHLALGQATAQLVAYGVLAILAFFVVRRVVATNWEAPADSENKTHPMLDRPDLVEPLSSSISPV